MRGIWVLAIVALGCVGCGKERPTPFTEKAKFVKICEDELKERLKSPSSYKFIEYTDASIPISKEEYQANNPDITATQLMGAKPYMYKGIIAYDSQNTYGATLREVALCELYTYKPNYISEYDVKVDGYSSQDYMRERLFRTLQNQ